MLKIMHFSPVRKEPEILELHLQSLKMLNAEYIHVDFTFYDDNVNILSSKILNKFIAESNNCFSHNFLLSKEKNDLGDERWILPLYERVIEIKNSAIEYFLKNDYDYLFLTDADLIIHPKTLVNLIRQNKDFCSSIFWTMFDKSKVYSPNAWYAKHLGFEKNDLLRLRGKGTFPVDFTGACTLLSRKILKDGVSFKRIPIVNYLGEDKHFCIRASVMGYQCYVNTEFPSFHIYNNELIQLGREIIDNIFAHNYLKLWLNHDWEKSINVWMKPQSKNIVKKIIKKIL